MSCDWATTESNGSGKRDFLRTKSKSIIERTTYKIPPAVSIHIELGEYHQSNHWKATLLKKVLVTSMWYQLNYNQTYGKLTVTFAPSIELMGTGMRMTTLVLTRVCHGESSRVC